MKELYKQQTRIARDDCDFGIKIYDVKCDVAKQIRNIIERMPKSLVKREEERPFDGVTYVDIFIEFPWKGGNSSTVSVFFRNYHGEMYISIDMSQKRRKKYEN